MIIDHRISTVGHSTRSIGEFIEILRSFDIKRLVDVRTLPYSRRHPQFSQNSLVASLEHAEIEYLHIKELGGLREPRLNSKNTALNNSGFRGYADHMETGEFQEAGKRLISLAVQTDTALMCAEAQWRSCHRSLLSDWLQCQGVIVVHILASAKSEPHAYSPEARIDDDQLNYCDLFSRSE